MKSGEAFFSIIIPVWNRAQLIVETLNSVLAQREIELEVIVVDDGSTDNTGVIVGSIKDARIKYIRTPNQERGAARNAGTKLASGQYIIFFDSDDILNPCLKEVYSFIVAHNFPPVVFGSIRNVTSTGDEIGIVKRHGTDLKHGLLYNNFLACGSVFIKYDLAVRFPFSEDRKLSGTEDWELWLRIFAAHEFTECPIVIFNQRHHEKRSLVRTNTQQVIERETSFMAHVKTQWPYLRQKFSGKELNLFLAERMTFMALTQSEAGNKKASWEYLNAAFKTSFHVMRRKRTWAIGKQLIFGTNA